MRERLFEIIEKSDNNDKLSTLYDICIMILVVLSLIPLAFKEETLLFNILDKVTVNIFIIDYVLRWCTADYKFNDKNIKSFIKYPFSFMAIIKRVFSF